MGRQLVRKLLDVSTANGQNSRKQKASDGDANDTPAKRTKSSSSDSLPRQNSPSPLLGESASEAAGDMSSEATLEATPAASDDKPSAEPAQPESAQPASEAQAEPVQLNSAQPEVGVQSKPGEAGGSADAQGGIKDVEVGAGVEHPLGGPKSDKPKRRMKFTKDSVRVGVPSLHCCLQNFADLPLACT